MRPAGLAAFDRRTKERSGIYSFEQEQVALDVAFEERFKKNKKAWQFFNEGPPSYRKTATWWVMSAKRQETRERRLDTLIQDSAAGRRIALLTRS